MRRDHSIWRHYLEHSLSPTRIFAHVCTCSRICNMRHWSLGQLAVPSISRCLWFCPPLIRLFVSTFQQICSKSWFSSQLPDSPIYMNVTLTVFPVLYWLHHLRSSAATLHLYVALTSHVLPSETSRTSKGTLFWVFSTFSRTAVMKTPASFHVFFPSFAKVLLPYNHRQSP